MPNDVDAAITGRRAVRAFLQDPVPLALIQHILAVASRAPSGGNLQPWKVHVITGGPKARLERTLAAALATPGYRGKPAYPYYPDRWFEPYDSRRRDIARRLYAALGIGRRDVIAMRRAEARNLEFFGAPVGLFFCTDRRLEAGSWLDMGMFVGNVMTAARGHGLDTCPQASFISHHDIVARHLGLAEEEIMLCGMALGYRDPDRPENAFESPRAPPSDFVTVHAGYGDAE
ncbi:nitroreductase [Minwuia thermotolerans]|uniref:nitroreductase n=1 Tax=Minwuia thermotolerans TaxID=2056226 RepID=UPI0019D2375D|nr:nitroreductase [Minwuia thermotolerans]